MSKDLLKEEKEVEPVKLDLEKVVKEKKLNCKVSEKGLLIKRTNLE